MEHTEVRIMVRDFISYMEDGSDWFRFLDNAKSVLIGINFCNKTRYNGIIKEGKTFDFRESPLFKEFGFKERYIGLEELLTKYINVGIIYQ